MLDRPHLRPVRMLLLTAMLTLATALGVVSTTVAPATATDHDRPLRIMLTGDSITHGFSGSTTWRYRLWREFQRQEVDVDFVGPWTHVFDWMGQVSHNYLQPKFDQDHAAWAGTHVKTSPAHGGGHVAKVRHWVEKFQPGLIVVMLGRNDLNAGNSAIRVAREMKEYVEIVHHASPSTRIIICEVLDMLGARGDRTGARLNRLNRKHFSGDPMISFARTQTGAPAHFDPRRHTFDGVHLNPTGETVVAQGVAAALHRQGILPKPPSVHRRIQWNPDARVRVRASGRTLRVAWNPVPHRYDAQVVVRRVGGAPRVSARLPGRRVSSHVVRGLAPGLYRVWVVPYQGRLLRGVRSNVVTLRVR